MDLSQGWRPILMFPTPVGMNRFDISASFSYRVFYVAFNIFHTARTDYSCRPTKMGALGYCRICFYTRFFGIANHERFIGIG